MAYPPGPERVAALPNYGANSAPLDRIHIVSAAAGFTAGVASDNYITPNDFLAEITRNISDISLQFGNGLGTATVSAANKGKIRYNSTTQTFQASLNGATYTNFLTGSGTATRVAFWDGAGSLSSNANFYWDDTNARLGVGVGSTPGLPIDVAADATALAQQWRENGAGTARVQMQVPSSFGQLGTSSNHDMGFMANGIQYINLERTGGTVFGSIVPATGTVMINALVATDVALVANNAAVSSVDIAKFQVSGSNRVRITQNGEVILGLAGSVTGKLTLSNAGGAALTSLSAGNAASTINYIWPATNPTAGQVLSAAAPSGGNVVLSWVTAGGGGATINPTDTVFPYRLNSGAFDDSNLIRLSTSVTEVRSITTGTTGQTLNIYGTAANNNASAPTTYVRSAFAVSTSAVSLTAQQASTGALTAGTSINITAANALAGAVGAAAGGSITLTSGNAAQLTSGTARGGDINFVNGTSVGVASTTALGQIVMPTFGRYDNPTICFNNPAGLGLVRVYGIGMSGGFGYFSINAPNISLCAGDSAQGLTSGQVLMNSQTQLVWVAGTSNPPDFTADAGLGRAAAGVIRVTDSSTGQGALLIAPSTATSTAPLDVVAQSSDAVAQTWREFSAGPARVKMQVGASFGLLGTSTNHAFGLMANNTQYYNLEATGGSVFGSIVPATGTVMVNALVNTDVALVANNASGSTIEIAKFQVAGSNRFRFLSTGEAVFGLASSITGKLTLSNASGAALTSISAGNAASTLNFIWPVVDPTAGQVLSASAPSGGNVTLSWVTGGGGTTINPTDTVYPYRSSSTVFSDSNLIQISSAVTDIRNVAAGTTAQTLNLYGTAANNTAAAPTTYVRAALAVSTTAVSLTAQQASTGALTAGTSINITAANALAGAAGAAAGGSITLTSGAAARLTSGNANGGNINFTVGAGIGTGTVGQVIVTNGGATEALPGLVVGAFNQQGLYANAGGGWFLAIPANNFGAHGSGMALLSGGQFTWSDNSASIPAGTRDTGIARASVGVIRTTNASTGIGSLLVAASTASVTGNFSVISSNAATSTIYDVARLGANSTGTAANGFGGRFSRSLQSSTTADQEAVREDWYWVNATHANRTAGTAWSLVVNATIAQYAVLAPPSNSTPVYWAVHAGTAPNVWTSGTQAVKLYLLDAAATPAAGVASAFSNTSLDCAAWVLLKGQGTNASPTGVSNGVALGELQYYGYYSTTTNSIAQGAVIRATATETWSSSANGTDLFFFLATTGTTIAQKMSLRNTGTLRINATSGSFDTTTLLQVGNYASWSLNVTAAIYSQANGSKGLQVIGTNGQTANLFECFRDAVTPNLFQVSAAAGSQVRCGLATGANDYAFLGGTAKVNATPVGNVGGGEDNLMTYSLPASSLGTDLDYVIIDAWGSFAANADNKTIKLYFGSTVLFDSTAFGFNGTDWRIQAKVVRTGATTQIAIATFGGDTGLIGGIDTFTSAPAETLSGAVTIKCTGISGSSVTDDVVQKGLVVQWFPVGQG